MECPHLKILKDKLDALEIPITYSGQPWGSNCREWIYYDCILNPNQVMTSLNLDDCIKIHINNDERSGLEQGLKCSICHDAIIGIHPDQSYGKEEILI